MSSPSTSLAVVRKSFLTSCLALLTAVHCVVADSTESSKWAAAKLAEGVYEIRHPDAPDTFPQGNTTVVIGERGVLVVDSCLLPSAARRDIEQIRAWTRKPVTYLVNTHWHFDHTLGNATYAEAFPAVQIVAHEATRAIIAAYNPGAVARYPGRAARFATILESGLDGDGRPLTPAARKEYERSLAGLAPVVEEMKSAAQLAPNVGFRDRLDIDLGSRPVQLRFLGAGNTAGDTVVYLPREKIAVVGDLLDHPVPYFFGGRPVDCLRTLQSLSGLDLETIVPGHGEVLHGKGYLSTVIDFLTVVIGDVERRINEAQTQAEVEKGAPASIDAKLWRQKFSGDDATDGAFFDESFASLIPLVYQQIKLR